MPDTLDPTFAPGDPVYKTGAYGGPGTIIGIAEDEHGRTYCVAHRIEGGHGRFVHVYPVRFLRRPLESEARPDAMPGAAIMAPLALDLITKAKNQVAYWRNRQRSTKCLDDGYDSEGNHTPIGDAAAWDAGYCNGRYGEAEWWLKTLEAGNDWRPTHRHLKRGSEYQVLGTALLQANEPVGEAATLKIYRDQQGRLWARPEDEFEDGRFQPLTGGEA